MRKLLLAILGLFPNYFKTSDGRKIKYDNDSLADTLKASYFKNASRIYCFCGGKIEDTFYGINTTILKCNQCKKIYYKID
jgi:NADH pyrophosphatase NudC (nudix superfamily)